MGSAYQIQDQSQVYYFTFQVVGWADIFTRQVYRDVIIDSFKHCRENKGMLLFAYVVMSNHVHAIIQSEKGDLSGLIRDFKKFTSKRILEELDTHPAESRKGWLKMIFKYHAKYNQRAAEIQFWSHENHAVELHNSKLFDSKLNYIHENPVRAGLVTDPAHYLYSSARNYSEFEQLIEIDYP